MGRCQEARECLKAARGLIGNFKSNVVGKAQEPTYANQLRALLDDVLSRLFDILTQKAEETQKILSITQIADEALMIAEIETLKRTHPDLHKYCLTFT